MIRLETVDGSNVQDLLKLRVGEKQGRQLSAEELTGRFVRNSAEILKGSLVGIYLHGSAAMGCFQPRKSDLDFLVVVSRPVTDAVKQAYMDMVAGLDRDGPAGGIEMSVVTRDVCDPFIYPTPFILHYSRMHAAWYRRDPADYIRKMNGTDRDLAAHFTVIRSRGRCLYGVPVREVFGRIPERDYLDALLYDIDGAEDAIADNPMYLILNLARVLAYLLEKRILSKREGGEWGLTCLPEEYRPLIRSALREYLEAADVRYNPEEARRYAAYMTERISGAVNRFAPDGAEPSGEDSGPADASPEGTPAKYEVRPVTIGDYDALWALWNSTEQSRRALNPVDDSREGIERYLKRNPDTCFAAVKEGRIAGVILSGHDGRRGIVHHLCVHPDFRRLGIAGRLVSEAEKALKKEGIQKVFGLVFTDNGPANAFWESRGYSLRTNLNYRNKSLNDRIPAGE